MRRRRWYGDPQDEHQPDVGDVLQYLDRRRDRDWWHLVLDARPVRGGGPEDLFLVVERHDQPVPGGIPQPVYDAIMGGGRVFYAEVRRRERR